MKNKLSLMLCLSFLPRIDTQPIHVPLDVRQVVKNQVIRQYSNQYPNNKIDFDDIECPQKGTYFFRNQNLVLEAADRLWQGSIEIPINSILEGNKIDFPTYDPSHNLAQFSRSSVESTKIHSVFANKWVWISALVSTAVVGTYLTNRTQNSQVPTAHNSVDSNYGKGRSMQ